MFETIRRIPALKVARSVALAATLLAAFLHVTFGLHAGALWRDEVTSVEIATMPAWSETWSNLAFESFPALFVGLLRIVAGVPATASDAQLRVFGVVIGLLILGALWLNARWLRLGVPLLSLALIGCNPMVIRYGDSMRAYGLGILLMLLVLGAIWRLMEAFTPGRLALAAITAVLSVQCLYYNAVLLGAVCVGAVAVALRHRDYRRAFSVLAIGALAAASLLPYLAIIRRVGTWSFIWKTPFTLSAVWLKFAETFGAPVSALVWIWIGLFLLVVLAGSWALLRQPIDDRTLFALVTLVAGTFAYAGFLKMLSYLTQPWYYIVFLAFAAVCIEMLTASIWKERALLGRAAFALLFAGVAAYPAFGAVKVRQTNIDLVAARVETLSAEGDLVLINPFPYGISFQYYYHGRAVYRTIPPMEDLRSHRADILKKQMMATAPMAPLLMEIEATLRGGHTVWLVGGVHFGNGGQAAPDVAPGYDGPDGWVGGNFYRTWSEQAGFLLRDHAEHFERIQVPLAQSVIHYENVPLGAFRGWRSSELPQ
jgi:hypothetical protein